MGGRQAAVGQAERGYSGAVSADGADCRLGRGGDGQFGEWRRDCGDGRVAVHRGLIRLGWLTRAQEVELLPYFMTLLKNHFPGMVGAVFVLNYGWSFAGMWGLAKRVLPQTALDRILFPTQEELLQFFDEGSLLKGALQNFSPSNLH